MAYLPDDIDTFAEIHVADIWNSAALAPVRNEAGVKKQLEQMQKSTSLKPEEVDRIVIGMRTSDAKPMMVIYGKVDINLAASDEIDLGAEVEHNGVKYYEGDGGFEAVWQPKSTIVVTGSSADIKKAIDANGASKAAERFKSIPASGHIVVVSKVPPQSGSASPALGMGMLNPMATAQDALKGVTEVTVVGNFTSDIDLNVTGECGTQEASTEAVTSLNDTLKKAKEGIAQMKQMMGGEKTPFDAFEPILTNTKVEQTGTSFTLTTKIPGSVLSEAVTQNSGGGAPAGMTPPGAYP